MVLCYGATVSTYFSRSVVCDVIRSINSTLHEYPFVVGVNVLVSVSPRDEAAAAALQAVAACFVSLCVCFFVFLVDWDDDRFRIFTLSIEGQMFVLCIKIAAS